MNLEHRTGCFRCEIGRLSHAETRTEETTESTEDTTQPDGRNQTAPIARGIFTTESTEDTEPEGEGFGSWGGLAVSFPRAGCARGISSSRPAKECEASSTDAGKEGGFRIQDPEPFLLSLRLCVLCALCGFFRSGLRMTCLGQSADFTAEATRSVLLAPGPGGDVEGPTGGAGHRDRGALDGQGQPDVARVGQIAGIPSIAEEHIGRGAAAGHGKDEGRL